VVGAIVLAALAYLLQSILFGGHDLSHIPPLAGEELGKRSRLREMLYNSKAYFSGSISGGKGMNLPRIFPNTVR
jgi:hypothetical protein